MVGYVIWHVMVCYGMLWHGVAWYCRAGYCREGCGRVGYGILLEVHGIVGVMQYGSGWCAAA